MDPKWGPRPNTTSTEQPWRHTISLHYGRVFRNIDRSWFHTDNVSFCKELYYYIPKSINSEVKVHNFSKCINLTLHEHKHTDTHNQKLNVWMKSSSVERKSRNRTPSLENDTNYYNKPLRDHCYQDQELHLMLNYRIFKAPKFPDKHSKRHDAHLQASILTH